jgi:chromosome segregation ATPase
MKKELNELRDMKKEYKAFQNCDTSKKKMRSRIKEFEDKLEQTESERNQWRDRVQEVSTQLYLEIDQLKHIISQLELEKKQSTEEIQVLEVVISKLEGTVSGLELENSTLKEQLSEKTYWMEKLDTENMDLKVNEAQIAFKLEKLQIEYAQHRYKWQSDFDKLETTALELEKQVEIGKVNQMVVNNTTSLVSQLPYNSPFRRPLIFFFIQGLSKNKLSNFMTSQNSLMEGLCRKVDLFWSIRSIQLR